MPLILSVLLFLLLAIPATAAESPVKIGEVIADLRFKDIRGLSRSLRELGEHRAVVFVFTTTHCPLVARTLPKLKEIEAKYAPQGVQFVAVNVGADDTLRDMAAQAIDHEVSFPFVKDTDLSCVRQLGIQRTPEVAVLDAERRLVYRGRVDDQLRLGGSRPEPSRHDLQEALEDLLNGRPVAVPETPVDGCLVTAPVKPDPDAPAPTFHQHIAPILQRRCVSCHRPGTAAPFPLMTYEQVAAQAEMVAEVVRDERMPPWYAHPKHGTFQNDPSLTKDERTTLLRWVDSGRLQGRPNDSPPSLETDASGWRIGKPDLVITMSEEHTIPATGYIPYRYVLLPYVFLMETWLEAVEIRPDNPAVVHHCNLAYVTSRGAGERTFITGHVPGGQPLDLGRFSNGVGVHVPQFSGLGLQIHYTTTGRPEKCRISIGLRYPRRIVQKRLHHFLLDPHDLRIPPHHGAYAIRSGQTLNHDITLLGLFTHMHLRGKDMTFFAEPPGQPREILLRIPNFNFEWQLGYEIEPGRKRLPKGTRIEAVAHYDNSAFNPYNPDPNRTVPYGLQSYDEMFNGYGFYVADDEDLQITCIPGTGIGMKPPALPDSRN